MRGSLIIFLIAIAILINTPAFGSNRVLSLDGDGDYVEMADSEVLNDIGSQVTVEVWIKATAFPDLWIPIIHKSDEYNTPAYGNRSYALSLNSSGFIELASAPGGQGQLTLNSSDGLIALDTWYHVAGVVDARNGAMRIFINGVEVARRNSGKDIHVSKLPLRIGWWRHDARFPFEGQIDEVRIWNVARTQEEIQAAMFSGLSGEEPGLVGYWTFDHGGDTVTDSSSSGTHGKLMGDAHLMEAELPRPEELVIPTTISGVITDESSKPISGAAIRLGKDGEAIAQANSDDSGSYLMAIPKPGPGLYDLSAGKGELGSWRMGIPLAAGEQKKLDFTLKENISIEGTLLMPDDKTPHVDVPVEMTHNGKVMDTILSDEDGKYRFINLKPGIYNLRCQVLGGYVYYGEEKAGKPEDGVVTGKGISLRVESNETLNNIDFRFPPFKKGTWRNYTMADGLPDKIINTIYPDKDGTIWFGTLGGGVFRYDGKNLVSFTTEDGLASNTISAICQGPDGDMWFGTGGRFGLHGNGVSRYDGKTFRNYSVQDGLSGNVVGAIYCDPDGILWFGTGAFQIEAGGITQYDGKTFHKLKAEKGSDIQPIMAIHRASDGMMWFGALNYAIYQYDGTNLRRSSLPSVWGTLSICGAPDGSIWFGTWPAGAHRYDGKEFTHFTVKDGLNAGDAVTAIHIDTDGVMWFGTSGGVSRYDGKTFVNFTTNDGLGNNGVRAIHKAPDGVLWFGTDGGISRYDERTFTNLTREDGLAGKGVASIHKTQDGVMWIATDSGVSRYEDGKFTEFPGGDELADKWITAIESGANGNIWFGTRWNGAYRYDGKELAHFTTAQGLANNQIMHLHQAPDGTMWFGTMFGVSSYDGKEFRTLDGPEGLKGKWVGHIYSTRDGVLWFATDNGAFRYDGKEFTNISIRDGLPSNNISRINGDRDGIIWFGTSAGVSRYDGRSLKTFTTRDGLVYYQVASIYPDSDGLIWFGSLAGVSCYDGTAWTSLDAEDGLAEDVVRSIAQDEDGVLWFGTDGGVTQYRPDKTPPEARIVAVKTGRESYTDLASIPPFTVGDDVTIEYSAIDFKTIARKRQYRYRIKELDSDWRSPTREAEFLWTPDKPGSYTFEVQAIDRDLNYSEPVSIELTVVPPFYLRAVFLIPTIGSGITLLATLIILATALAKRRRQVHAYQKAAVLELQDAREMQMSLLPETAPMIAGVEIQGKSMTANTVGGDFFGYLKLPDGRTGIVVADVSGKGLKAAMSATMTNGMLHEVVKIKASSGRILSELNAELCPLMQKHMFTALSFAIINEGADAIQWSNAAQPLPLIKRGNEASEAEGEGELPLGMMADVAYTDYELKLEPGDIAIFYTDGIIEAENEAEEMYGTERLVKCMADMDPTLSAEGIIGAIFRDESSFMGSAQQYDDMTVVVLKKL